MTYVSWPATEDIENDGSPGAFLARGLNESLHDLDCDFVRTERPHIITDVLERCLKRPDQEPYSAEELWGWTLPRRLRGLVAIVIAGGRTEIETTAECKACGEAVEVELALSSLTASGNEAEFLFRPEPGINLVATIPTGRHQIAWLDAAEFNADASGFLKMATTLIETVNGQAPSPEWSLPGKWLASFESALAEHDPVTALSERVQCPDCSADMDVDLDLEALLLRELERSQQAVLEEIYLLARAFHWTESDIFDMPIWRRRAYMHRCQQEMGL